MNDSPYIVDITTENIQQLVVEQSDSATVLLDFWAPWCGPCKTLIPILTKLAAEYQGKIILAKVNVDEQGQLAQHFGARSVPLVKIIKNRALVDEFVGALPETEIREILRRHIDEGNLIEAEPEGEATFEPQNFDEAEKSFLEQLASNPEDDATKIKLAGLYLDHGKLAESQTVLAALSATASATTEAKRLASRIALLGYAGNDSPKELAAKVTANNADLASRLALGARLIIDQCFAEGLDHFLDIVRRDSQFQEEAGRKAILEVFNLMPADDPLISQYRKKLFSLLH